MARDIPDFLSRILEYKRAELEQTIVRRDELEMLAAETRPKRRDFRAALTGRSPAVIAEIKRASPSKGIIAADTLDPAAVAQAYENGGAAAISVLTDEQFFRGSLDDLSIARGAVRIPVLRKDFTIDEYHVAEAAANCADAVLLITAILSPTRLRQLREYAQKLGLTALVEVHDETELESALDSGAQVIGVNNRNLRTFEVTLETSLRMAARIPAGIVRVSESGIRSPEDIRRLGEAGYHAFLVGEHLMRSRDPQHALRALLAPEHHPAR
jgi:indole-3-glycerol phosphate synthase